jgi:hypothetical protein
MTTRFVLSLLLLCCVLLGCQHDVRLEFPAADAVSNTYECTTAAAPGNCTPSTVVNPADQNSWGTEFITLPGKCQKSFHRIVVHDAGSSSPTAHVECAPVEGPIAPLETIPPPGTASVAPGRP